MPLAAILSGSLFLQVDDAHYTPLPSGWDVEVIRDRGEIVAATFTRNDEFHFQTFGKPWKMTRTHLRQCLTPIIAKHGCVRTKTPMDDSRQQRFNLLIGFVQERFDDAFVHFKMTALRHA